MGFGCKKKFHFSVDVTQLWKSKKVGRQQQHGQVACEATKGKEKLWALPSMLISAVGAVKQLQVVGDERFREDPKFGTRWRAVTMRHRGVDYVTFGITREVKPASLSPLRSPTCRRFYHHLSAHHLLTRGR